MGKDLQRALLWVILFTSCFMLWDNYQIYKGGKSFFQSSQQETVAQSADASIPKVDSATTDPTNVSAETVKPAHPIVVTTDVMKVTFDLSGASMVQNEFLNIPRQHDWKEVGLAGLVLGKKPQQLGNVELLEMNANRTYLSQTGVLGGDFPTHKDAFTLVSNQTDMGSNKTLDVVFEAQKGNVKVTKTYTFTRGQYDVVVKTAVTNVGDKALTPTVYYQIVRDGKNPADTNSMASTFTGPAVYSSEEKFQKLKFSDVADNSASFQKQANNGWIAMVQHHFVSAWVPKQGEERTNYVGAIGQDLYRIGSMVKLGELAPGATVTDTAVFYSGPQDQKQLEALAPGLELVVDYGWLTFLAKPIYWLLSMLYSLVGNWGWSIVLLTCIVKLILYPISAAGYRSMARMKEVSPRLKAIQDKYKDDRQKLNQAMAELYREEKINPVSGCLPIFLQIPVFLALYWVLLGSVELRGAPWILWVQDLGTPDPWFILPLVMAATMFLQIFLNPKPADPTMARVTYIMPLVFSVMFFIFASGLVLYWLTNNVLSILQQWWINKTIANERVKRSMN